MQSVESVGKVHFWYIVGILVGLLVLVATDRWTDKANFTVFLSNAATLTSLVLGVVAIFYSIVSNVDLSKSLGNIIRVSDEIGETRAAMAEFLREAKDVVASGRSNANELREASAVVTRNLDNLEGTLVALRDESQQLRESLSPIPGRIDELAAKFAATNPPPTVTTKISNSGLPPDDADRVLRRTSLVGVAVFAALAEVHRKGTVFDCDAIAAALKTDVDYIHGLVVGLHSVGWAINKAVKDKVRVLEIMKMEPAISALSFHSAKDEIRRRKGDYEEDWLKRIDNLAETLAV